MVGIATAAGTPSYRGTMIPERWSPKLLVKFYAATVLSDIANTEYEGEVKNQGDTVHIRTTPSIAINDYVKGQKLVYQQPEPEIVDLVVDKGKSWSFVSDDVTKAQADYDYVNSWTTDAARQLKIAVERPIWADIPASAHASNRGATAGAISGNINLGTTSAPVAVTKTNVIDILSYCEQALDEQNVPQEDRYLIFPAWFKTILQTSDLKNANLMGDGQSILLKGLMGQVANFKLYSSNLLSTTVDGTNTVSNIIFGHKSALTFASQLLENEGPMRDKDFFGDFYRGLQVYGYKVIKPTALGWLYAIPG